MVAISSAVSLTLLRDELDSALNVAGSRLEMLIKQEGNADEHVALCIDTFHQVNGICKMLEIPAATLLTEEMEAVAHKLGATPDALPVITALGGAIVLLQHYFEYVQLKNREIPELLLDNINDLRLLSNKNEIPESHFFSVNLTSKRTSMPQPADMSDNDKNQLLRRMRHMYQVGLLGILRDNNNQVHLKLMFRALSRLDTLCQQENLSRLIWVAQGAIETLLRDNMKLTRSRKTLLSQYDRQIKLLVYSQMADNTLTYTVPPLLIKNSVYIVSLSSVQSGLIGEIKAAFDLTDSVTEAQIKQERAAMSSGGTVIKTVANELNEELEKIKSDLDYIMMGTVGVDYGDIENNLVHIANTLIMVGQEEEANKIKQQARVAGSWRGRTIDPESDEFQSFVDQLLIAENAINRLTKQLLPQDDLRRDVNNQAISYVQLDDARLAVLAECRGALSLAKRSVATFTETHDPMHLSTLPSVLSGAAGGLVFLDQLRAKAIINGCSAYIFDILQNQLAEPITLDQMETLADALTSVDYFLESMEELKPIGESILEIAENSLKDLGYPVQ